ncbi:MAG TPA: hypothetical protein VJT78_05815, partial [Candidatus Dormibacteraeota bacterium]|nr:hypothetical protein [Candidatus Dormibacteraeota bacterium]
MLRPVESAGRVALARLLRTPRYEVLPTRDAVQLVAAFVPKEVTVTVTASPRRGMPSTILAA